MRFIVISNNKLTILTELLPAIFSYDFFNLRWIDMLQHPTTDLYHLGC